MTLAGLLFDPTAPELAVLTIDGPDYYGAGWAAGLDPVGHHVPGCSLSDLDLQDACACQPPLYTP